MKKCIFIIPPLLFCQFILGQNVTEPWFKKHPIVISAGNYTVGMPFYKLIRSRYCPSAFVGTEFYYNKNKHKHTAFYQTLNLGGFYSKYNISALILNTEVSYRYSFNFGLFADGNLGVGYSQNFRSRAIYKLNESGEYEQVRDWGQPRLIADLAFSMGYDFSKKQHIPLSLFIRYGVYAHLFYYPDIPAFPQHMLQIGTRFFIQ